MTTQGKLLEAMLEEARSNAQYWEEEHAEAVERVEELVKIVGQREERLEELRLDLTDALGLHVGLAYGDWPDILAAARRNTLLARLACEADTVVIHHTRKPRKLRVVK